jgi:two-component system NarL family sensor kinase
VPYSLKFDWPRQIAWVRVVLAATTLGSGYIWPPQGAPFFFFNGLLLVYLAFSLVVAIRGIKPGGLLGLLALFGDAVYFLVLVSFGVGRLWLASVYFLYLLAEAVAFYGPVEVVVVVAVAAVFCAVLPYAGIGRLEPTVLVAGVLTCGFAVHKRRRETRIGQLNQKLEDVQKDAEKARDAERQRIASDFHDGPLQSFISLQMRLEILRKLLERDFHAGMQDLMELQTLAQSQIRDLRVFLHSMRPVDVDGASLVAMARRSAESFQKESGIPVTFLGTNTPLGLSQEMTAELLQMLREALHNVQKHAGATRVAVSMEKTDRGLEISVDDNGHGFNFAGTYTLEELEMLRLGPASLKRRARSLNADLQLESRPGRGAGLKFRIPLQ